jgi:hypothetical protein
MGGQVDRVNEMQERLRAHDYAVVDEAADMLVELREALREVIRHAEFDPDCRENELASIHRGQLLTVIDVARAALEPRK